MSKIKYFSQLKFILGISFSILGFLLFVSQNTGYAASYPQSSKSAQYAYTVDGIFQFPLNSYSVSHPFLEPRGGTIVHLGEDVGASPHDPVYAAGNGNIKYVYHKLDCTGKYGNAIVIEHQLPPGDPSGAYVFTIYGHLEPNNGLVTQYSDVQRGQLIGYVSANGNENGCTQPHLHFGVHKGQYAGDFQGLGTKELANNFWIPTEFIIAHKGGSGTCIAPTLTSPADGYQTVSNTISLAWNHPMNCSNQNGFYVRVGTTSGGSNVLSNYYIPGLNGNITIGSQWFNQDLYWSVQANATGSSWSTSRRFRISSNISTPTVQPTLPPTGWNEVYYSDNNLGSQCGSSQNNTSIYMFKDSDAGWSPPSGCPNVNSAWSVRMENASVPFTGGDYNFGMFYDDGARLYIDDQLRLDGWNATQHYEGRYISPGNHKLRIEYKNNAGHAIIQLWWRGPGALPGNDQTRDPFQWWANYWGNQTQWQDSVGQRNEGSGFLDHDWGTDSPGYGLPVDHFSTKFERTVYFECGTYRFHLKSDDGVRFWIDGNLERDYWQNNVFDTTIDKNLPSGNYNLTIDQFENGGAAHIFLDWTTLSTCPIPNPIPQISSSTPSSAVAGSSDFILNITGSNFLPTSTIYWNSQPLTTQYIDNLRLSTVIPSSYISSSGTANIHVNNPSPGGGDSNNLAFSIISLPTAPSAEFDAWPQSGVAPLTSAMHIVSTSNITSCSWDYGDGQTSTTCTQLHDHIYNNSGSFTVSLTVNGPGGSDSMTRTNYITVSANGDSYEPDNTSAQAKEIYSGSPQTHSIVPATDIDWVKFTLSQTSAIHLETSGSTSSDTRMWLYDSNLLQLDFDDDDGIGNYSLIDRTCNINPLSAGTYYVKIESFLNGTEIPSYNISYSNTQNCTPPQSPVPLLTMITPTGVLYNNSNFKMTLIGTNFVTSSVAKWGGSNLATTYVDSTKLTAEIPTQNLASPGTKSITVYNPAPGGGTSNSLPFVIHPPNEWFSNGPVGKNSGELVITPSNIMYVGTAYDGVYKSIDGGANWIQINNGLTNLRIQSMALDPLSPSTIYVGTDGYGVFKTTNGGSNWVTANIGLTDLYVYALAVDPITPAIVYAGTAMDSKIFKSVDGGSNWSAINTGLFVTKIVIDPVSPSTVYVGTLFNGVYKTTNGGINWMANNVGLGQSDISIYSLAIDPITHTTIYAGKWGNGVYKSTNGGGIWTTANSGYASENIWALAIDSIKPTILYAGTGNEVIRSTDSGTTWSKVSINLGIIHSYALNRGNPNILYAGTSNGVFTIQFLDPGDKKVYIPLVIR